MTDLPALLAAVLARPADDTPRLVLADWLDEHGEPERAEFIRVQIQLARMEPPRRLIGDDGLTPWVEMRRAGGPGYYVFTDAFDQGVQPGDRIDVKGRTVDRDRGKVHHGLLVRRVTDRGSDGIEYVVVRDADSRPWAGEPLRKRAKALFDGFGLQAERAAVFGVPPEWYLADEFDPTPNPGGLWPVAGVVRRGFVDEVRLPLARLVGGELCPACGGEGVQWRTMPPDSRACPDCGGEGRRRGTGRTPGVAAALGRLPLTRITPTDAEPWRDDTDHEYPHCWWRGSAWRDRGEDYRGNLPDVLFDLMGELYPAARLSWELGPTHQHLGFPDRDEAVASLSATAIEHCRREAAKAAAKAEPAPAA